MGRRKPHRYPKNRKRPYKHKVGSHMRKGKIVDSYDRGKGRKPAQGRTRAKKMVGYNNNPVSGIGLNYDVHFYYGYDSEDFYVPTDNYGNALLLGFNQSDKPGSPTKIIMRNAHQ